ncbi:MAG: outer membrane beta-barrel protein [Pseudomonadota bacterium]
MRCLVKTGLIALSAVALSISATLAADLDPIEIIEADPIKKSDSGFYLRGDIGYTVWGNPELTDDVTGAIREQFDEDLDNALFAGVGVGFRYNKFLRTDLTFDVRKGAEFDGRAPCGLCGVGFTGEETNLSAYTLMANIYFEAGEFGGFTPYIGGGVGGAFLDFANYTTSGNPAPQAPVDVFSGEENFRFAWALMAGTGYSVNKNLSLDVGYRYLNISDGTVTSLVDRTTGFDFGDVDFEDLDAHEVRVGFRYTFGH